MRRTFRKEVRERFRTALAATEPPFEWVRDGRHAWLNEGDTLYRWTRSTPERTFFLLVLFWPGSQRFTLEAAFSADGRYPVDLMPMSPIERPDVGEWVKPEPPVDGAFRCRIGAFFGRQGDHWWGVSDQEDELLAAMTSPDLSPDAFTAKLVEEPRSEPGRIEACVQDAMDKVRGHVIPWFSRHLSET